MKRYEQVELFVSPIERDIAALDERGAESLARQCVSRLLELGVSVSFVVYPEKKE